MSNKRKAPPQAGERPSKKQQLTMSVKVSHLQGPDTAKPVIATTGAVLPEALKFFPYSKQFTSGSSELLLQSSDHATIDFIAVESSTIFSTEKHMKHYVAVFEPAAGKLDVTEAKKVVVRPHIRQFQTDRESDEEDTTATTKPSTRAALTEAFGTKKSKRAIQSIAENRLLARGGDGEDQLSQAILNNMAVEAEEEQLDISDRLRANKPLPPANVNAEKIEEVYPLSVLVIPQPWNGTMSKMSLAYWKSRFSDGKTVNSRSRFVSNRVEYITNAHLKNPDSEPNLQHVQLLRYIEHNLDFHRYLVTLPSKKRIPDISKWPEKVLNNFRHAPEQLVSQLLAHFFPDGVRSQRAMTLLRSTILALTLHVPPPSFQAGVNILISEPTDIELDIGLDRKGTTHLLRELGCKVDPATETELVRWGLTKLVGKRTDENGKQVSLPKPKFARLRFPLQFPKLSQGQNSSPAKRR